MTLPPSNAVRLSTRRARQFANRLRGIRAALDRRDYETALANAQFALRRFEGDAELHHCAGCAARALGQHHLAIDHFSAARSDAGLELDATLELGAVLIDAGRARDAVKLMLQCVVTNTAHAGAAHGAALALCADGDPQRALDFHAKALQLDPRNSAYLSALGHTFLDLCLYSDALQAFDLALSLAPQNVGYARNVLLCHFHCQSEGGQTIAAALAARFPQDAGVRVLQAELFKAADDMPAARRVLRRAIALAPDDPEVLAQVVASEVWPTEELSSRLEAALRIPAMAQSQNLLFAYAHFLSRCGDEARAYDAFRNANAVAKASSTFDSAAEFARFEDIKACAVQTQRADAAPPPEAPIPIFVVGIPRSGSTLTENILGAHPDVTPLGEITELRNAVRRLRRLGQGTSPAAMEQIQSDYLASAALSRVRTRFAVDKNLGNFRYIGQIMNAFPTARVLHVVRDPKAVGWSLFQQSFDVKSVPYAFDPADIIEYHAAYRHLMQFWCDRFGSRILTVDYDALTDDPDVHIRRLLADLGLPWHDACLAPHEVQRPVNTVSQSQVTREIYKGSSQTWRRFERFSGHWLSQLPDSWRVPVRANAACIAGL